MEKGGGEVLRHELFFRRGGGLGINVPHQDILLHARDGRSAPEYPVLHVEHHVAAGVTRFVVPDAASVQQNRASKLFSIRLVLQPVNDLLGRIHVGDICMRVLGAEVDVLGRFARLEEPGYVLTQWCREIFKQQFQPYEI